MEKSMTYQLYEVPPWAYHFSLFLMICGGGMNLLSSLLAFETKTSLDHSGTFWLFVFLKKSLTISDDTENSFKHHMLVTFFFRKAKEQRSAKNKLAAGWPAERSSCQLSPCAGSQLLPWSSVPCVSPCGSFRAARPVVAAHWSLRNLSSGPDRAAPEPTAHLGHSRGLGRERRKEGGMWNMRS